MLNQGVLSPKIPRFKSGRETDFSAGLKSAWVKDLKNMEKQHRMNKKYREKEKAKKKKKRKGLHIAFGIFSGIVIFITLLGLAFILVYKSGQAKLKQSAEGKTPEGRLLTDAEREQIAREKAGLTALQWEDNWVVIGDKIYAYDEECVNLLFLGIDRPGDIGEETDFDNWEAGQTDAIFMVSLNPSKKSVSIIGIPRNSMVNVDIYDEENHKIDTVFDQICLQYAFAGGGQPGLDKVEESVETLLYGLPVHGAFAVGYDAVGIINDMAGGVDVEVLETFETSRQKFVEGETLHLDGDMALSYVRGRNFGQIGSPTLRLQRQKQYLVALIDKVRGKVKENPMLVKDMYGAVSSYMNTDVTLEEVVYLAAESVDYRFGDGSFYLLQGEDRVVEIPEEERNRKTEAEPFYDDYYLDEESIKEIMLEVFYEEVVTGEE